MYGFVCSASAFLGVCILLYMGNYVSLIYLGWELLCVAYIVCTSNLDLVSFLFVPALYSTMKLEIFPFILLYMENYVHRVPKSIAKEVEKGKKKEL